MELAVLSNKERWVPLTKEISQRTQHSSNQTTNQPSNIRSCVPSREDGSSPYYRNITKDSAWERDNLVCTRNIQPCNPVEERRWTLLSN